MPLSLHGYDDAQIDMKRRETEDILEAAVFKPRLDLASYVASQEDSFRSCLLGDTHEHTRIRIGGIEWITPAKFIEQVTAESLGLVSSHVHSHLPRLCRSA